MADEKKYIEQGAALDAAFGQFCASSDETERALNAVIEEIRAIPAADVRPVVLCRDCVYAYPYGLEIKCTKHSGRADRFGEDATYSEFHSENWYCADAQRKREKGE